MSESNSNDMIPVVFHKSMMDRVISVIGDDFVIDNIGQTMVFARFTQDQWDKVFDPGFMADWVNRTTEHIQVFRVMDTASGKYDIG